MGRSAWVGGRLLSPFFITEGDPYRPEMILWLELPEGLIVSHTLVDPDASPVSFAQTLRDAMRSPMIGPPREPSRVRVADALLATEVRAIAPEIEVEVAPTPELDDVLRSFAEYRARDDAPGRDPSYLEGGRIPAEAIAKLFRAAELLHCIAPWKFASDSQVIRLDIPGLGVEGACISIIGQMGESLGIVIFPSLVAYERFLHGIEVRQRRGGPIDMGTTVLSLDYERGAELPDSLRKEIANHGWPVAGPDAYPMVHHRDPDGMPRPLKEKDIAIATACAMSLSAFFGKYRELFADDDAEFEPISESYFDDDDLEVRFTVPYEAGPGFGLSTTNAAQIGAATQRPPSRGKQRSAKRQAAEFSGRVGRNQLCPCGSGKKYKKCCLAKDQAEQSARTAPASIHDVDRRLVDDMMSFAIRKFGETWWMAAADFDDHEGSAALWGPWSVYHFLVEGRPVVNWYLEKKSRQLSNTELTWLQAQQSAWLSVWEVIDTELGHSITLKDLLTDEERTVHEVAASKSLKCRDVVLGRIVDHDGVSALCGIYPRHLPPVPAAEVVRRIRGRLRRKRAVPIDRLRDEKIGRYMIARWDEAVTELDMRRAVPPRLQNTDGEDFLLTIDHFDFDLARQKEIEQHLAQLDGIDPPEPGDDDPAYVFSKSGNAQVGGLDNTLIGRATLSKGKLRLETNSVPRADALRERIETACGDAIRHRAREHSDPFAMMDGLLAGGAGKPRARKPAEEDKSAAPRARTAGRRSGPPR